MSGFSIHPLIWEHAGGTTYSLKLLLVIILKVVTNMHINREIDKKRRIIWAPSCLGFPGCIFFPNYIKPGIPGRPIVSSCDLHTKNTSRFVDYFLQPLTRAFSSNIWDTTDFLWNLQELPATKALLVTLDVSSPYMNIPLDEGINVCKEYWIPGQTNHLPRTIYAKWYS